MKPDKKIFYGWPLVAVGWLLYGFGVAPVFYSWSFYLPNILEDLSLSRADGGFIYGAYILFGGIAAPVVGVAIGRWGLRKVYSAGFIVSSVGIYLTGRAESAAHLYLWFAVFTGFTHAFATTVPAQTLVATWFLKYRSRVMAVVLTAAGIVAPLVYAANTRLLAVSTWRTGFFILAAMSAALGVFAAIVVRDDPEALGQKRDGIEDDDSVGVGVQDAKPEVDVDRWTPREALRTPQFALMVICGLGYAVPYYVLLAHSRLHLQDQGMAIETVAAVMGSMTLVSTVGRLAGSLGDFISPPRLLGFALLVEALGTTLFIFAASRPWAFAAAVALGVGFGMAYISQATTFSMFFGRRAFATTTGIRFFVGAVFTATMPGLAGWSFDRLGTYTPAFLALACLGLVSALVAFFIRPPRKVAA